MGTEMNSRRILKEANDLYLSGHFETASKLYLKAAEIYGLDMVEANLELCRQLLPVAESRTRFDKITEYLLLGESPAELLKKQHLLVDIAEMHRERSPDAEVKKVRLIPDDWPKDLKLAPLPDSTNDYAWALRRGRQAACSTANAGLSVVVPTYNRSTILGITLACLVNQQTSFRFEVIVADDGSAEDISAVVRRFEGQLDIKHVRQRDDGYRLCAVRNFGMRAARYDWIAILDCDMAPNPVWVQAYCELLQEFDGWALIGPRRYIDTHKMNPEDFLGDPARLQFLPEVMTNNKVAGHSDGQRSVDWRLSVFSATENLRLCDEPFRYFSGGNVAFHRKWLAESGWFDEDFAAWGGEDNEFGYRLYRAGCYFRSVDGALAYHQEPPGRENETNRETGHQVTRVMMMDRVPYFYRKLERLESFKLKKAPLVSIYIPAFNCEKYIEKCIDSALNQTVPDLEVCVCDDGSTDQTPKILQEKYSGHPRVRWMRQKNGGIGKASNAALRMCRGYYIGQLDSDDFLNPDAVEICLKEFMADRRLACVYTTNKNIDVRDGSTRPGYNWPTFSREKLSTAMIVHHFRMFTIRAWKLTEGFDEGIKNAIDYDMYLKLSEVGPFHHVNKICYNRVIHGANTSVKQLMQQKINHFKVVQNSLGRQNLGSYEYIPANPEDEACRKYALRPTGRDPSTTAVP